jgi:peptide/nickel transport system permease protein
MGNTVANIVIATAIVNVPLHVRIARTEASTRRNAGDVEAARLSGYREGRILLNEIPPSLLPT